MMPEEQLVTFVRDALPASFAFRPYAVFDESLDCIRVVTRDCSVNEVRVNDLLTLVEANYPLPGKRELVGFTIKGVAHLCQTCGISSDTPWRMADFLDAIVASSTSSKAHVKYTVDTAVKPLVAENPEVENIERQAA